MIIHSYTRPAPISAAQSKRRRNLAMLILKRGYTTQRDAQVTPSHRECQVPFTCCLHPKDPRPPFIVAISGTLHLRSLSKNRELPSYNTAVGASQGNETSNEETKNVKFVVRWSHECETSNITKVDDPPNCT